MKAKAFLNWVIANWAIELIVLLAVFLRLCFRSVVISDGGFYSLEMGRDAWQVTKALSQDNPLANIATLRSSLGIFKLLFVFPLGLGYLIFGFNDLASISWSLISAALNVLLFYKIAEHIYDHKVGLIAALLLAVSPADVLTGGVVSPNTTLLTVNLLAVYYLTKTHADSWTKVVAPAVFVAIDLIYSLPLAVTMLLFYGFWFAFQRPGRLNASSDSNKILVLLSCFGILLAGFYPWQRTLQAKGAEFLDLPGIFLHIIPFVVAFTVIIKRKSLRHGAIISFAWLISSGVGLIFSFTHVETSAFFHAPLVITLLPIFLIEGAYLAKLTDQVTDIWMLPVAIIAAMLGLSLITSHHSLLPSLEPINWLSDYGLLVLSRIISGVLPVGFIFSAAILYKSQLSKTATNLAFGLIFCVVVCSVASAFTAVSPYRAELAAAKEAVLFLSNQPLKLPVFLTQNKQLDMLNFVQGFNQEDGLTLRKNPASLWEIKNGYILIPESSDESVPNSWWPMTIAGFEGPRTVIFRSLSDEDLLLELTTAKTQSASNSSFVNLERLYGALMNNGRPCEAYNTWMRAMQSGSGAPEFGSIPVSDLSCFERQINSTRLLSETSSFDRGGRSAVVISQLYDENANAVIWTVHHVQIIYPDGHTFSFQESLEPNSFYLYSAFFKAPEEAIALFWKIDGWEGFASRKKISDWQQFSVLLYTGGTIHSTITLSPTLLYNYGFVSFYNLRFVEIE